MTKLQSEGLPQRLRQAMEDSRKNITDLAADAKVSRPFIYGLLAGTKNPTLPKVEALALALGVRPAWLAFGALSFGTPE